MNSRKDNRAFIGIAAGGFVQLLAAKWPQYLPQDVANALTALITVIFSTLIYGIATEDAGAKTGQPTPDVQKFPPVPPVAVLLLVLGLGLLAAPLAAQPSLPGATATAYGTPDLSALVPAEHGRQRDAGVQWPGGYTVASVAVLVTLRETATGRLYYLDPSEMAEGRAGLHQYLIAHTRLGAPMSRWNAQTAIRAEVETRLRAALVQAAARAAAQIPALVGRGDVLITGLLQGLVAR